jgi:hypothetical protein
MASNTKHLSNCWGSNTKYNIKRASLILQLMVSQDKLMKKKHMPSQAVFLNGWKL